VAKKQKNDSSKVFLNKSAVIYTILNFASLAWRISRIYQELSVNLSGVRGRILFELDENRKMKSEASEFILPRDFWMLLVTKVSGMTLISSIQQ
jgi:hypothetical protein